MALQAVCSIQGMLLISVSVIQKNPKCAFERSLRCQKGKSTSIFTTLSLSILIWKRSYDGTAIVIFFLSPEITYDMRLSSLKFA